MGQDRVKNGEKDLQEKLQEINQNLDRVKLRIRSGKFYIRGMCPPRPGETENVRTELATGCSANHAGLRVAKMKAEDINLQLLNDRIDRRSDRQSIRCTDGLAERRTDNLSITHPHASYRQPLATALTDKSLGALAMTDSCKRLPKQATFWAFSDSQTTIQRRSARTGRGAS